ncbi:MAG TPA: hypothetical protein VJO33_14160 [Gemmatimonadaceae bacterium]|nr:hypothetical protein [Gemmatimonadaceae bacterium]
MQRQIILETSSSDGNGAEIASRPFVSVHVRDNHLQAASYSLRQRLTQSADGFTDVDRSL